MSYRLPSFFARPSRPLLLLVVLALLGAAGNGPAPQARENTRYLIQGEDLEIVRALVRRAGGEITHELGIIDAVAARLTTDQATALAAAAPELRLYTDRAVEVAGASYAGRKPDTGYPTLIGAAFLHDQGITGRGVTVAVVDTGVWTNGKDFAGLRNNSRGESRILAQYDAVSGRWLNNPEARTDHSGHGSHVASVIASSLEAKKEKTYHGVAPGVDLVAAKAFGADGAGSYADVIRAIDQLVAYKDAYGIRVMNLSFGAPPRSHYWDDPLNQAVMRAWEAGIVVVASAGNGGPEARTIGVPGNVPYVITVGAMTDRYTPKKASDDVLASFSAIGPTHEGFVKPEVVAPGGHLLGLMDDGSRISDEHPEFHEGSELYVMSGTSQAAAVVSGAAALLLAAEPLLTPDEVKCRLMAGARPALDSSGELAYSVFQQGAGLIDVAAAVEGTATGCANRGLDVAADLAGTAHFGGRANQAEDGSYYLMDLDGYVWPDGPEQNGAGSAGYTFTGGYVWPDGYIWSDGYLWSDGTVWYEGGLVAEGYVWSDGSLWPDVPVWSNGLTEPMAINRWVDQE